MLISLFSICFSVVENNLSAIKYYFYSTAIYTSAMLIAGISFIKHLFSNPKFNRTPKNSEKTTLNLFEILIMQVLGVLAVTFSIYWESPFSPILLGQGLAYISFQVYNWLNLRNMRGIIARLLVYLPGLCMLLGIVGTWIWGKL